jgi:hypothetical protein
MFNSVALDIVIGLVFIYLLYSLLATIMSELIASMLGLRARNLKEAIDRMLNDEKPVKLIKRILDSFNITKSPKNPVVNTFYNHPEIKYLGSSGLFKAPSNFKSTNFSKTVMSIIFGEGKVTREMIDSQIEKPMIIYRDKNNVEKVIEIDPETAGYIKGLWDEAQGDVEKFKAMLGNWFDRTMEQTIEWYKRKIRIVTIILGFMIAWLFNADTFVIVKNLSTDKKAREQIVNMAIAYVENNQAFIDTVRAHKGPNFEYSQKKLDSLLVIKNQVEADLTKANTLLGIGCRLPAEFIVTKDSAGKFSSAPPVEARFLKKRYAGSTEETIKPKFKDQWSYLWYLFSHHFFGFLVTTIALSLGAPFWFDLLSKVMSLKTGKKAEPEKS